MSTMMIDQALQTAVVHHQAGQLAEAEVIYRQVLAVQTLNPDALHLLGVIASQTGQQAAAIELIARAIAEKPDKADYHTNLGEAYRLLERWAEAIACFDRALTIQPDYPEAHNNRGNALLSLGRLKEAAASYEQALALRPDYPDALNNLGTVLLSLGRTDDAMAFYAHALALQPDYAEAYNNRGNALMRLGRTDAAIADYEQALKFMPQFAEAHTNLGNARKDQGQSDLALACYRRAVALAPHDTALHSNLIYALHLHPDTDHATLSAEHRQWNRQHGEPRRRFRRPHTNDPNPDRCLKIGYVSPDLREHPVGHFLLPLFEQHDHTRYEIVCYADVAKPDSVTERLRACSDQWKSITGLSEEGLAEQIRSDGIDVLVDLSLHVAGNRLTVFARKPAPVQLTYLAYPGAADLDALDYRLSDPFLVPPGLAPPRSSEQVYRLPNSFWLFAAPEHSPEVIAPPALTGEGLTFGCLNNFCKVNAQVLALWARILNATPDTRLLLLTDEGSPRERVREIMAQSGIGAERVQFASRVPAADYYAQYTHIDIALDTFPYTGGTTTCDALWMGVPVVSLVGKTEVGRGGLSILSNIGLPELVAQTEDEYIKIAVELANDLPRLTALRAGMRTRMLVSPLMDAPRFARNIEDAYRAMWKTWCQKQVTSLSSAARP